MDGFYADYWDFQRCYCYSCRMESNLNQDGMSRPSYVFSADPLARPSEINFDGIKLDSLVNFP